MSTPALIVASQAPTFSLPGITFTGLAAPSRGATETAVWMVLIQPGTPAVPHQLTREEILVALEGRARAMVGTTEYELEAGGALIVPPRTDFSLSNPFTTTFRAVSVLPVGGAGVVDGEEIVDIGWFAPDGSVVSSPATAPLAPVDP